MKIVHPPDTQPDPTDAILKLGRVGEPILYHQLCFTNTGDPTRRDYRYLRSTFVPKTLPVSEGLATVVDEIRKGINLTRQLGFPGTVWLENPGGVDSDRFYDFDQFRECVAGPADLADYAFDFRRATRGVIREADVKPVAFIGGPANDPDLNFAFSDPDQENLTSQLRESLGPIAECRWAFDHMGRGWDESGSDSNFATMALRARTITKHPMYVEGRTLWRNKTVLSGFVFGHAIPCLMARDLKPSELNPVPDDQAVERLTMLATNQDFFLPETPMTLPDLALLCRADSKSNRPLVLATNVPIDMKDASYETKWDWRMEVIRQVLPWCDVVVDAEELIRLGHSRSTLLPNLQE